MRKDGNIEETGSSQSMEELVCLAKELQTCASCSKNILIIRIDPFLFATYFLILVLKEVDLPWREYMQ